MKTIKPHSRGIVMIALLGAATIGSVPLVAGLASASTTTTLSADRSKVVTEHAGGLLVEQAAHPTTALVHSSAVEPTRKAAPKSAKKREKKAAPKATSKAAPKPTAKASSKSSPATPKVSPTPGHRSEPTRPTTPPKIELPKPSVPVAIGPTRAPLPPVPVIVSSPPAPVHTSSPPPTSAPSSSSAPVGGVGCISNPSACGYPDASNTGALGALTPSGSITQTTNGQVIQNLTINGHIRVTSANVTIKNVRIIGDASLAAIDTHAATGPVTIDHVTISYPVGVFPITGASLWGGNNLTVSNSDISGSPDGIDASGRAVVIHDNWIHGLQYNKAKATHDDDIQTLGGDITISHNTLDATAPATNSCLQVGNLQGDLTQLAFTDNFCNGGGFSINANPANVSAGTVTAGPIKFVGNRFGNGYRFGIKAHLGVPFAVTWSGNISDVDGHTLP